MEPMQKLELRVVEVVQPTEQHGLYVRLDDVKAWLDGYATQLRERTTDSVSKATASHFETFSAALVREAERAINKG